MYSVVHVVYNILQVTHFRLCTHLLTFHCLSLYYLWPFFEKKKKQYIISIYRSIFNMQACVCIPMLIYCICVPLFLCRTSDTRQPAIKKRTRTSKGLEAQTQHTCWQSTGKPGEVKLEREGTERRRRAGWVNVGENGRAREKRAGSDSGSTHTPSPQPSVWSRHARGSTSEYVL